MSSYSLIRALGLPSALLLSSVASASDYAATALAANDIHRIVPTSGQTQLIGGYTLASPGEFRIPVLARGLDDTLYGISDSVNESRLYRIDEQTGQATVVHTISTGPVSPAGAAIDPTDGALYFTNTFGFVPWPQIYRMNVANGNVAFLGNIGPVIQHWQLGLAFDPSGRLFSIDGPAKALLEIDKNDPVNGSQIVGTLNLALDLTGGGALFYDPGRQSLVFYEASTGKLYTVDRSTGAAAPITGLIAIQPQMTDVEHGVCDGGAQSYGAGCAGSGGFVPQLSVIGCPTVGNLLTIAVADGLGGSNALLFFGNAATSIPIGGACSFLVSPLLPPLVVLPLGGAGPGAGSGSFSAVIPPAAQTVSFTMQALVIDPFLFVGAAASNGLAVSIP